MPTFTIALLQMASSGRDQAANQAKADGLCRQGKCLGADIALFPEMWNIGYSLPDPKDESAVREWAALAIGPEDDYIAYFRELADALDMAIAVTYLERHTGAPRNAVSIIDRKGEVLLTYAKAHTCDFSDEAALTPGDGFPVCELAFSGGTVKLGCMICFDREFPESARLLMLGGAEVILVPNACDLEINRLSQFRSRAYENMTAVAMTNYAAPQNNGHSIAFDGIAFQRDERDRDMLVVEAGPAEAVYLAPIDLDALRAYREREPWGDAFRRPALYEALLRVDAAPPFQREAARRGHA